jgi:hypothetical protein
MDLLREKLKCRGGFGATLRGGGGGGSTSSSSENKTTNTTQNVDQRMAVQDGVAVNGSGNSVSFSNNSTEAAVAIASQGSDAVNAIANAGADIIKNSGGAVVNLYKDAGKTTADSFNKTVSESVGIVDKLINQATRGFDLSAKAIDSFQPVQNKQADTLKWAAVAMAVVAATFALKDK